MFPGMGTHTYRFTIPDDHPICPGDQIFVEVWTDPTDGRQHVVLANRADSFDTWSPPIDGEVAR